MQQSHLRSLHHCCINCHIQCFQHGIIRGHRLHCTSWWAVKNPQNRRPTNFAGWSEGHIFLSWQTSDCRTRNNWSHSECQLHSPGTIPFLLASCCQEARINLSRPRSAQVKRISDSGLCIQSWDHYLTVTASSLKIGLHPPFDLGVFISLHPWDFWVSSPVIVIVKICVSSFDMVAEQRQHSGLTHLLRPSCPVQPSHDDSTMTRLTSQITSSSREKERGHWSSKLQEETDIKTFLNDPKLNPRLSSPTSFDGVKPSYVEWSEEVLTFLSVTDYQDFVPILQAVTGHKEVITKKVFIEGVLSEIVEEIKDKNLDLEAVSSGARVVDDQDAEVERIKEEIKVLEEKKNSRGLTLMKADNFLRYFCFTQRQVIPTSWFVVSWERQAQTRMSSPVWRSGVRWLSPMQVQLKLE